MSKQLIDLSNKKQRRAAEQGTAEKICSEISPLFHDSDRRTWANVDVDGHRETFAINSEDMRHFMRRKFFEMTKETFGIGLSFPKQLLNEELEQLSARALFDGPEQPVSLRVSENSGVLYVDLCDQKRRAIRIGSLGWEIVEAPPIFFRRTCGMLPLPIPEPGGSIDELAPFLNVSPDHFVLVKGWLLAALRSQGPFPLLVLTGPAGSTKKTFARALRSLVDPNSIPLGPPPRDSADLDVGALHSHVLAFDNISRLSQRLSDALCRVATGGGIAQREFFTRQEQVRFPHVARPMILNGITEFVTAPDLLDRSIILPLRYVATRRTETDFWAGFTEKQGRFFGALLTAMAEGVRNLPNVQLGNPPLEWPIF